MCSHYGEAGAEGKRVKPTESAFWVVEDWEGERTISQLLAMSKQLLATLVPVTLFSMKSHLSWRVRLMLGLSLGLGLLVSCKPAPSYLLFASARSGNWEIFVQTADDSGPQNLTRYPSVDRYPDWSTDRRKLVFASDQKGSFDLYLSVKIAMKKFI